MTEIDAARWIEAQPGLKILIGNDREVTLTDGRIIEITARGILAAVIKAQRILRAMQPQEDQPRGL